jgi:glycosyltransferase involved in cell wall biosynthesis
MDSAPGPIAYLTGLYPRATDTFIQREIAALRALGFTVETCSVRETDASHHVGPEQKAEFAATFQVLKTTLNPLKTIRAHAFLLRTRPQAWISTLRLALRTRPAGLKAFIWQMAYFLEAGVLAHHLRSRGVVHLHNHFADACCSVAMLMSSMSGIPFSLSMHGPGIFFQPMHWRIDEKIARASFTACISHFCRSQGMYFSDDAHWDKLKIVHCGVEPEKYGRDPNRSFGKRLLFVGRLDAVKGVPLLLDAVAELKAAHPDIALTVVGDGPIRADLEAQARALDMPAEFVGYKSQDEVAQLLDTHDMLILPSFAEGVPVVLMEAMAARIPVIASRVGGVQELVEDGKSGFVLAPGDEKSLISALDKLLSDPDLCARMGTAGRAKVEADFNINKEGAWLGALLSGSQQGTLPSTLRPEPELKTE